MKSENSVIKMHRFRIFHGGLRAAVNPLQPVPA